MARMIPDEMEEDNGSYGERQAFEALKKLPDEYVVFHSVRWNARNEKNTVVWGEADFTIFHPDKGIIVIEVKSGGIECVNNTWRYIRTDNHEIYPMKNPMKQADRSKYRYLDLVEELFADRSAELEPQYCMVESAVWFPSISRRDVVGELPLEYRQEIVLFESALSAPQRYIDGIYDFYEGYRHTRLTKASCEKIVDAFAPHFMVMPSLRAKRLEQEERFVRLTREQSSLLDYLEEQRVAAIQGAAGTGKTWLAVEKACRLAENGKVLFLCFNQFLRLYLQEMKADNGKKYKNVEFYNLPQLACQKLGVTSVEKGDISQFLDDFDSYDWDYKHIVIDEGQDFDSDEISKLYEIALLHDGAFYVFFDKNQFVQGDAFPEWLQKAECRLVLNINCRNTFSIADTSGKPISVVPKVKSKGVKGDMPKFYICSDVASSLKRLSLLIDQYRGNGYAYSQICILTVKTEATSLLNGIDHLGSHQLTESRNDKGVLFTTARKFKGLESDVIILVDVDTATFEDEKSRQLFYVGASRAKHNLDIVFNGEDDELKSMAELISGREFPSPIIGVARSLSVKPVKS